MLEYKNNKVVLNNRDLEDVTLRDLNLELRDEAIRQQENDLKLTVLSRFENNIKTLEANVNNSKLSDADFRVFASTLFT